MQAAFAPLAPCLYNTPMLLTRELRFSVGPPLDEPVTNSTAGWPSSTGVQPYLTLQATVAGEPNPQTGYLCNIRDLDRLMRERALPLVNRLVAAVGARPVTGERIIAAIAEELGPYAPSGTRWAGWKLNTTPFLSYATREGHMIRVTQRFEFAAAHRLHCAGLSDEQNRATFGKCNNPNGHGHNYELEVTVVGELDPTSGYVIPLPRFEQIVNERVIERLDHKHLNADCAEFRELNPSVENIVRVIWGLLEGRLAPAKLDRVRVWETGKTSAEYGGSEQ